MEPEISDIQNKIKNSEKSILDTMFHASFRKIDAFDLLFFGIGMIVGIGIGVNLILK